MKKFSLIFLFLTSLFAHKLNLFTDIEDNKLYIYSYFASGSICKNCKIELLDKNKKLIKKLKTNPKGEYYLKDYSGVKYVKVEALGGHAAMKELNSIKTKEENKKLKKELEKKAEFSYFESLLALLLIILIFRFLKRIKK